MATTVNKKATTRKPSGMTGIRDEMRFEFGWKIMDADHGAGQWFIYQTNLDKANNNKWHSAEITASDTSASVSLTASSYYPTTSKTLSYVLANVRGKRSTTSTTSGDVTTVTTYDKSEWAALRYNVYAPKAPVVSKDPDNANYPRCTFSWDVDTTDSDNRPFVNVEWQSMLVKDCNVSSGSKLRWAATSSNDWSDGTGSDSGDVTFDETLATLAKGSYTRFFRVRSRGAGGASEWRYARHVYAKPYTPVITKDPKKTYAQNGNGATTKVRVEYDSTWAWSHPIDNLLIQYLIATPAAGLTIPEGASWQTALTVLDGQTGAADVVEFVIDQRIPDNTCLWVRVSAVHDIHSTPSVAYLVKCGALSDPEFTGTVNIDVTNNKASVTVKHNSTVDDSKIALYFHRGNETPFICAVYNHNQTENANVRLNYLTSSSDVAFSIREFQGTATATEYSYKVGNTTYTYNRYKIEPNMQSDRVMGSGNVPVAPTGVSAKYIAGNGSSASQSNASPDTAEVLVDWSWNWYSATHAEVSWSQDPHAWESTNPPSTYTVDRIRASQIYVSGLQRGMRWYFRVRFIRDDGNTVVYGDYSKTVSVLIAEAPEAPTTDNPTPATVAIPDTMAAVSTNLAKEDQWIKISWKYINSDGTTQRYADIREVTVEWDEVTEQNVITQVAIRAHVGYRARYWFRPTDFGWTAGQNGKTYYLQVRVTSTAGLQSDWSDPVAIIIAKPVSCSITNYGTSNPAMAYETVNNKQRLRLHSLPLTVNISGAGAGDTTKLVIERAEDFDIVRPDESTFHGCEGETILQMSHTGSGAFTVNREDLIGVLDDYAWYRIIATVEDNYGQSKSESKWFQVHWNHQPVRPGCTVSRENGTVLLTPTVPSGTTVSTGDVFDIYRISADLPQLIVEGGTFGQTYRDPYPAIGDMGGHKVVYRSLYGDYFDSNGRAAWIELRRAQGDYFDSDQAIIEFDKYMVTLDYNIDLNNQWTKDFQETTYLGGSVTGDWNPAVKRKTTVNTVTVPLIDEAQIRNMRRLANHAGICHVRTPDGSSFAADVQVSEGRSYSKGGMISEFTLTITRVDSQQLDGELVEVT